MQIYKINDINLLNKMVDAIEAQIKRLSTTMRNDGNFGTEAMDKLAELFLDLNCLKVRLDELKRN
jgi:hypothetical protein